MTWHDFIWFAAPAVVLWLLAGTVVYTKARHIADWLIMAFILLMITWIGVNYLPSAQGSVHTYM